MLFSPKMTGTANRTQIYGSRIDHSLTKQCGDKVMCYRRISCISDDHLQYKLGTSTKCQEILEIGTFNAYI